MQKIFRYNLQIVMILLISFNYLSLSAAFADPTQIRAKKIEADALKKEIGRINQNLSIAVEDYNESKFELSQTVARIIKTRSDVEKTQKDIDAHQELLGKRVNAIYRYGDTSFVEVLLAANSLNNFLNRIHYMVLISNRDGEIIASIKKSKQSLVQKLNAIEDDRKKQQLQTHQLEEKKTSVMKSLAYKQQLFKDKTVQIEELEKQQREREARIQAQALEEARKRRIAQEAAQKEAIRKQQEKKLERKDKNKPSKIVNVPSSGKGYRIVDEAMRYLGVRYVWGGSSPATGFDCSGYTAYVYAKFGVSLPHSSRAQFKLGTSVSRDQLQPGDLVFFGSPIHHVSIYIGNGNMVDAPQSGDHVRVRNFSKRRDFAGARRYL